MKMALFEELIISKRRPRSAPLRGAIGLIELGDAQAKRPMIANRPTPSRVRMGDFMGDAGNFLFDLVGSGIDKIAGILADALKVPLDLIGQGVGVLLTGFAGLVANIPIIGDFAATILLAVNSLAQFAISLPEMLLQQVQNLGKAFETLPAATKSSAVTNAMKLIFNSAPPSIQPQVQKAIDTAPKPGGAEVGTSLTEWLTAGAATAASFVLFAAFG